MSVDHTISRKKKKQNKTSKQMKMENLQKQDIERENWIVSQYSCTLCLYVTRDTLFFFPETVLGLMAGIITFSTLS